MTVNMTSSILWGLIFSHLLADFTFQTNFIAQWKDKSIWGRWIHVAIFLFITYFITYPAVNEVWYDFGWIRVNGWLCVFILTILHLMEDHFRIWCVHEKRMNDDIIFFLFDQFVHIGLIVIFTPSITASCVLPVIWLQLGTLFILNTHFTTIMVFYLERTFLGDAVMQFKEKHLSIIERMGIALCCLIPGSWWIAVVGLWIVSQVSIKLAGKNGRSWINLITSYFVAVITGLLARIILF